MARVYDLRKRVDNTPTQEKELWEEVIHRVDTDLFYIRLTANFRREPRWFRFKLWLVDKLFRTVVPREEARTEW